MPAIICNHPGCQRTSQEKYCDRHKALPESRESAAKRGYDDRWRKHRKEFLKHWVVTHGPFCNVCKSPLKFDKTTHVDHIRGHSGQDDPMFWDYANLQAIDDKCHAAKTRKEKGE